MRLRAIALISSSDTEKRDLPVLLVAAASGDGPCRGHQGQPAAERHRLHYERIFSTCTQNRTFALQDSITALNPPAAAFDSRPSPTPGSSRTVNVEFTLPGDEDEETTKKPVLQPLRYKSFTPRVALHLVVEPYPPLPPHLRRSVTPAIPLTREGTRQLSEPVRSVPNIRQQTPLFLPDFDRDSVTPAPSAALGMRSSTPQTQQIIEIEDDDDPVDMMLLSQAIRAHDSLRSGRLDEDDDNDVLYADADEARTAQ